MREILFQVVFTFNRSWNSCTAIEVDDGNAKISNLKTKINDTRSMLFIEQLFVNQKRNIEWILLENRQRKLSGNCRISQDFPPSFAKEVLRHRCARRSQLLTQKHLMVTSRPSTGRIFCASAMFWRWVWLAGLVRRTAKHKRMFFKRPIRTLISGIRKRAIMSGQRPPKLVN